jgi:hypothetical protein
MITWGAVLEVVLPAMGGAVETAACDCEDDWVWVMLVDCCVAVLSGGRELPAVAFTGIDLMSGVRLSLAEAFLYVTWDRVWGRKWHQEELSIWEG